MVQATTGVADLVIGFEFVSDKKNPEDSFMKLPQRGTTGAAGYDFYSPISWTIAPGDKFFMWTDVKARMPSGVALILLPRSSSGIKFDIRLANTVGLIDSDYYNNPGNEGNIGLCLRNDGDKRFVIKAGDTIMQGVFIPYYMTTDDITTEERVGGIGSTSK